MLPAYLEAQLKKVIGAANLSPQDPLIDVWYKLNLARVDQEETPPYVLQVYARDKETLVFRIADRGGKQTDVEMSMSQILSFANEVKGA